MAVLRTEPPAIDPEQCVFCGSCRQACASAGAPGAILPRPDGLPWDPAAPPAMVIDPARCTRCAACLSACPAGAIDLDRRAATMRLTVADVVFATGFSESAHARPPEYGHGILPDVLTAMEFEALTAEGGAGGGLPRRRSTHAVARSVAFIQCAGARDQRYLPYCAGVCCMHGLKQARWVRRRSPDTQCAVFFTDLRAVGKGYEAYARQARQEGVALVRSRPGLVVAAPETGGGSCPVVRYEDPASGRVLAAEFDLVVLNGGLAACPLPGGPDGRTAPQADPASGRSCGFCQEPGDVAQSVVQGSRAAAMAAARWLARTGGQA
jgi:heterodisulfide reductase subunit A